MSGPLEGVRIVELAGSGAGPVRRHDAGRRRRRHHPGRPARPGHLPAHTEAHVDLMNRGRRSVAVDLKHPEGVAAGPPPDRWGRRPDGGVPARGGRAAGHRPGRLPGPQPEARLRPDDRVGAGRADWPRPPATTSTTSPWPAPWSRSAGPASARCRRSTWSATSAAAACCWPSAWWRPSCRPADREGPGDRRRHGRRRGLPDDHDLHAAVGRDLAATSGAPTCSTPGPTSTRSTRPPTAATWAWVPSSPSSTPSCSRRLGLADAELPDQMDRDQWPAMKERFADHLRHPDPGRVGGGVRRIRCLRGAGAVHPAEATAHPHNVHRGTFTEVAGVVQPAPAPRFVGHAGRHPASAAQPRPARRRGPGRVGVRRRRGGQAPPGRRHPLSRAGSLSPGRSATAAVRPARPPPPGSAPGPRASGRRRGCPPPPSPPGPPSPWSG